MNTVILLSFLQVKFYISKVNHETVANYVKLNNKILYKYINLKYKFIFCLFSKPVITFRSTTAPRIPCNIPLAH